MKELPEIKDFRAPEGYFEGLTDKIMAKRVAKSVIPMWTRYAAAAMIVFSVGTWMWTSQDTTNDTFLAMNSEIDLYIASDYWSAEDILSLSEDPSLILEQILDEETIFVDEEWIDENLF